MWNRWPSRGIVAEQTGLQRLVDGVLQTSGGKWILARM